MGRHAGWIAAASALASRNETDPPHIILMPEVPFAKKKFIDKVKQTVANEGFCVVVASEGTRYKNGMFLADSGLTDAFGHKQGQEIQEWNVFGRFQALPYIKNRP